MVPSLPLLSCELSVSVKENPDRKKNKNTEKLPQTKRWRSVRKYPSALKTTPWPPHRKASRCTGFHTARVFTERYLRTGIRIVITPTLLCRLLFFSISLWCHNLQNCICNCLHLLIISVRLLKMLSCLCRAITHFSFWHNMHRFVAVLYGRCIPRISHDVSAVLFGSFSLQISLESSAGSSL